MPTPEQLSALQKARAVVGVSKSPGGQAILDRVAELVSEAEEDCLACMGSDEVRAGFQRRWQQRLAVQREIEKFIASHEAAIKQIEDEIQQEEQWEQRQIQSVQW